MPTIRIPYSHLTRVARVQSSFSNLQPTRSCIQTPCINLHAHRRGLSTPLNGVSPNSNGNLHKLQPAIDSHQRFRRGLTVAVGGLTFIVAWYYARQRRAYSQQANEDSFGIFSSLVHRRSINSDPNSTHAETQSGMRDFLEGLEESAVGTAITDGKSGHVRKKRKRKAGVAGEAEEANALLQSMQAFFNDLRGEVTGVTFKDGEIHVKRGHTKPKGKRPHKISIHITYPHVPKLHHFPSSQHEHSPEPTYPATPPNQPASG